jgi:hypothetical protein
MVVANNKIDGKKKYTLNAGNFDGHAGMVVQCGVHRSIKCICSFMQSH